MMGPCAKLVVTCTIITPDGLRFVGRNDCHNPQPACPREPGEGYEKCKSVCQQLGHAEEVALRNASVLAAGAHAYVEGHDHACRACQKALFGAGIAALTIGAPPEAPCSHDYQVIHDDPLGRYREYQCRHCHDVKQQDLRAPGEVRR